MCTGRDDVPGKKERECTVYSLGIALEIGDK
jgi:hypothetical protein